MQDFMIRDVLEGFTVAATLILIAYSPIFRALGKRIMHGKMPPEGVALTVDDERVDQLSAEVSALRRELDATHERLDFAERMLAQSKGRAALPQAGNG